MNILMIASGYEIGGVTYAMRNLCNELIARGHIVNMLNLPGISELPEGFDKRITLINLIGFAKYWDLSMAAVKKTVGIKKLWLLLLGIIKKATNKGPLWRRIVFNGLYIDKHYDISVAFRQSPVSYWLAKYKCDSDLSVGFWHTDADFENVSKLEDCLHYPDKICCVSDAITQQMINKYPQLRDKFSAVYNLFDASSIRALSDDTVSEYDSNMFNIVTVGRLSPSKKITRIPQICYVLKKKGLRFKWYIIGDGEERADIEKAITEYNVSDCMILLGAKSNPYPYIKNADLFVLTSVWESYGMVVTEALILGIPVVAGNYPALHEILYDGVNGLITENSVAGIGNAVYKLVSDTEEYEKLKNGAEKYSYSSDCAVNQLLSLKGSNQCRNTASLSRSIKPRKQSKNV